MHVEDAERRAGPVIDRLSVAGAPAHDEFAELDERHRSWRVYVVGRTAPVGGGPRLASSLLAFIPHTFVANAFERIAEADDVDRVRRAYIDTCERVGDRLYGHASWAVELAEKLERLAAGADFTSRPLAAAWADLPTPPGLGARIERAASVLREHRGGLHVSILTAHGFVGPDSLLLTALWSAHDDLEGTARAFGWQDDDLAASYDRLQSTGRIDVDGGLTPRGRQERTHIEEITVARASDYWHTLTPDERTHTIELLEATSPTR